MSSTRRPSGRAPELAAVAAAAAARRPPGIGPGQRGDRRESGRAHRALGAPPARLPGLLPRHGDHDLALGDETRQHDPARRRPAVASLDLALGATRFDHRSAPSLQHQCFLSAEIHPRLQRLQYPRRYPGRADLPADEERDPGEQSARLGTFVLAATGIYALVGLLVGNRAVAFVAGLAYAFLPYRYAHIWHLNQLGHAWTPWALFALVLLIQRGRWRHAIAFGLLVAVQVLTSFYVGFQIAFAIAVVLIVAVVAAPRVRTRASSSNWLRRGHWRWRSSCRSPGPTCRCASSKDWSATSGRPSNIRPPRRHICGCKSAIGSGTG